MFHRRSFAFLVLLALGAVPAFADLTFSTSGSGGVSGSAVFHVAGNTLTITLTNGTQSLSSIAQVLDGFAFSVTGGSGLALTNVSASGFIDCQAAATCQTVNTFVDWGNQNPGAGSGCTGTGTGTSCTSPYTWGYSGGLLAAGGSAASLKPGGIVNNSVNGNPVQNAQHNDYLLGPVAFAFSFSGAITNVSNVSFYWGTQPLITSGVLSGGGNLSGGGGNVPEPTTIVLLGSILMATTVVLRKKAQRSS
jgi:hypothetical protein